MKVYHFSEMAYPQAWDQAYDMDTFRIEVPNQYYDPKLGAQTYHRHFDEFQLCDELGINTIRVFVHPTLVGLPQRTWTGPEPIRYSGFPPSAYNWSALDALVGGIIAAELFPIVLPRPPSPKARRWPSCRKSWRP